MGNALTGDYDIVIEVGIGAVDRLLATLHQQGASDAAAPKFLHSLMARVGSSPKLAQFELAEILLDEQFGSGNVDITKVSPDVLASLQKDTDAAKAAVKQLGLGLASIAEAPADESLKGALATVAAISVVRGVAKIQVSTPTLTLTHGSTSEVTVHAEVRAVYDPDAGTAALPDPIHGEVQATFLVNYKPSGIQGKPALEVKPSDDNNKILFIPASGTSLTASEAKQITRQVQRFLRNSFDPMTAQLPDGFMFGQFKSLVAGSTSGIALPVKLSGHLPAFAIDSVTNLFLAAGDAFAIAVSKDYIYENVLQDALQQIKTFHYGYELSNFFLGTVLTFDAWVSNVKVDWSPDTLTLVITGGAQLWTFLTGEDDYSFAVTQELTLTLNVAAQVVSLQTVGDVLISGLPQQFMDLAKPEIQAQRDAAVAAAQGMIQSALTGSIRVGDLLKTFDAAARTKYTAIEITAAGVILRGSATMSPRPDVMVEFSEASDGMALNAVNSWIPAGTVDRFIWSWVVNQSPLPWKGKVYEVASPHQFIFRWSTKPGQGLPPPPPWHIHQMCLQVEGSQVGSASGSVSVSGGSACRVRKPEWLAVMASWWAKLLLVPVWGPDPGPEAVLDSSIVAHMNVRLDIAPAPDAKTSAIIHFAGGKQAPLPPLADALRRSRHRDAGVPVIVVLPRGSFEKTRFAVEQSLGSFGQDLQVPLVVTEDYEGDWTQAFNVTGGPATYIASPEGELAWKHQGELDTTTLTAAIDEHVTVGTRRRSRQPSIALRVGAAIPDLPFGPLGGHELRRPKDPASVL